MPTTYREDIYAWSREQADIIRGLAEVRHLLPNALDLENVAEEIEDVGGSQVRSVRSHLKNMFVHLIKIASAPESVSVPHWRNEILVFQDELTGAFLRSMRQDVDFEDVWAKAKRRAKLDLGRYGVKVSPGLPARCPFDLDQLTAASFDAEVVAELEHLLGSSSVD